MLEGQEPERAYVLKLDAMVQKAENKLATAFGLELHCSQVGASETGRLLRQR